METLKVFSEFVRDAYVEKINERVSADDFVTQLNSLKNLTQCCIYS